MLKGYELLSLHKSQHVCKNWKEKKRGLQLLSTDNLKYHWAGSVLLGRLPTFEGVRVDS